ncbi:hypothetical protein F511_18570 [Dorcoceras hygrometricum]|uniref:Uncharacterized protein n=1 Tax=Dorcoceras hygrometricum TaxID=472368 RepID=A0A2Z7AI60_9LAMI|nr:hypothetical protein F511_18570 [Dorcoceras hygrometricum]
MITQRNQNNFDAPYYHIGTRGPSRAPPTRPTLPRVRATAGPATPSLGHVPRTVQIELGRWPEDHDRPENTSQGLLSDVLENPFWIRLSLFRRSGYDICSLLWRIRGRYDFPYLRNKIPENHGVSRPSEIPAEVSSSPPT